jgi:hypothetical protein
MHEGCAYCHLLAQEDSFKNNLLREKRDSLGWSVFGIPVYISGKDSLNLLVENESNLDILIQE